MNDPTYFQSRFLYPAEQKLKWWGQGEWVNEPDLCEFEWVGLKCRITRVCEAEEPEGKHTFGGHFCGYVRLPNDHPDNSKDILQEHLDYDVHGGLTYGKDERDGFWIGFDCAHSHDVVPSMIEVRKQIKENCEKMVGHLNINLENLFHANYRNFGYVLSEVKKLAEEVKEKINDPN